MRFHSTRDAGLTATLSVALRRGIAPDGGLYVPDSFPQFALTDFDGLTGIAAVAPTFLAPFFAGDPLAAQVPAIVAEAFNFPVPLKRLPVAHDASVLELFHGPTVAFKDFGARFLAACMVRIPRPSGRTLTILVATSGDTGGAVAAAFHGRPGIEVVVLFPRGLVSPRQELQLTCWGGNVRSLSVAGTFDDCQRLVKAAFADPGLNAQRELSSANSINIGRLLPQACYYVATSLAEYRRTGQKVNFIVPSGNLGNVLAAVWARKAGLPIGELLLTFNANRTVPEFLETGVWAPRPSVPTLASAMDVGNPSNMERLRDLYPEHAQMLGAVRATSVSDAAIQARIQTDRVALGETWCPHTACAAEAYAQLSEADQAKGPWVLVGTAHPAKFPETVEPLVGHAIPVPESLARLLELPRAVLEVPATLEALAAALQ
ncbi:MAG: threonine synthase [Pseudomonadota bacterium]|jgi:threonine synthase